MVTRSNWYWLVAAALWLAVPLTSHAQAVQSIESIQAAAEKEVRALLPQSKARYYVTAARLDPRLRLAQCAAPLEAFVQNNSMLGARSTIGVRCGAQAQWTIYVGVNVETEASILVLRRALARRSPVAPDDVELQTRRLPGIESGFINDLGTLSGRRLRRALPAGSPLTAEELVPDVLVRRGQQVTLLASNGSIEIRAQGHALTEGGASDRIRVQNVNSLKVVEGVVENAGTVRVGL
jgi:flagella basal body P-ring formation protein FlgA